MRNGIKTKIFLFALLIAATFFAPSSAFSQDSTKSEFDRARFGVANASTGGSFFGDQLEGDYKIGPGDLIEISVWKELELSRQVRVRPDGKFSYPLIGTVTAAGLTIEELQQKLKTELTQYVRFPEITVAVIESTSNKIVVLGEVSYPGIYSFKGSTDVLTAVGLAGDFLGTAKRESVLVISDNMTDKPKVRRVNVFRSFRHGTIGPEFMLKPNDVVYVPKTFIADWNKTVNDLQPTLNTLLGQNFTNFFQDRGYIRAMYYNRDKPVGKAAE
jgi:polysaccharide export outer membrane protein